MAARPSNITRKLVAAAEELEEIVKLVPADAPPQVRAELEARMQALREATAQWKELGERNARRGS